MYGYRCLCCKAFVWGTPEKREETKNLCKKCYKNDDEWNKICTRQHHLARKRRKL